MSILYTYFGAALRQAAGVLHEAPDQLEATLLARLPHHLGLSGAAEGMALLEGLLLQADPKLTLTLTLPHTHTHTLTPTPAAGGAPAAARLYLLWLYLLWLYLLWPYLLWQAELQLQHGQYEQHHHNAAARTGPNVAANADANAADNADANADAAPPPLLQLRPRWPCLPAAPPLLLALLQPAASVTAAANPNPDPSPNPNPNLNPDPNPSPSPNPNPNP